MHPQSSAEVLLSGWSSSYEASAIGKLSSRFTSLNLPSPNSYNRRLFHRVALKTGKTPLVETTYPVEAHALSQRGVVLTGDADIDGKRHSIGSLHTTRYAPLHTKPRLRGKYHAAQVAGKVRWCNSWRLNRRAEPVPGKLCRRGSAQQDANAHGLGTSYPSKKARESRVVQLVSRVLPGRVNADDLATRPSHSWCGTDTLAIRKRMLPYPCFSAMEAFPSGGTSTTVHFPRISPGGYGVGAPPALLHLHVGTAGITALRRSSSGACPSCPRRNSSLCRFRLLKRSTWEGQAPAFSNSPCLKQGECRHAHQHDCPVFAPSPSAQLVPTRSHVSQLLSSTTRTVSTPVIRLFCLPPARAHSLRSLANLASYRRILDCLPVASKYRSRHTHRGGTTESTASPTSGRSRYSASRAAVRAAAAASRCLGSTTSGAAVPTLQVFSTGLAAVAAVTAAQTSAALCPPSAVPFRAAAAVAADSPKNTDKGGEGLQLRTFSTRAGRQCPEQDVRQTRPIRRLLIANRGEIAIRIHRACKEMGIRSIGIFSEVDSLSLHRQVCDESYKLKKELSPVAAYLNYPEIIEIALKHKVDAIHPGYGFLSENAQFAAAVEEAGLMLVGPSPRVIALMGDKVQARMAAVRAGVHAVPGTNTPIHSFEEASAISEEIGFPIMLKAAYGGGGRGMRRVLQKEDLQEGFERATSEAETAFGDGALFVEKLVEHGVHIEVQILADHYGDVVHLRERDCTVQRRHQKVVEIAPAPFLESDLRERILADAVKLMRSVGYQNAGTVEFLIERNPERAAGVGVQPLSKRSASTMHSWSALACSETGAGDAVADEDDGRGALAHSHNWGRTMPKAHHGAQENATKVRGRKEGSEMQADGAAQEGGGHSAAYFIEVNPRLQVEHTVSEEITGIDIVKTQIALREGASLQELGITQSRVDAGCDLDGPFALQCRITSEDSQRNFQPSTGRIELYQPSTGPGIRLDGAIGASGAMVTPYYDSLLVKIIAKGGSFLEAVERARRALRETKIRGVTTNIPFILNVLQHPDFLTGKATTRFVDDHQMLRYYDPVDLSAQNICKYLAQIAVNGPLTQLVRADAEPERKPVSSPPLPPVATGVAAAVVSGGGGPTGPADDVDLQHLAALAHSAPRGLKTVLDEVGPAGFAKKLRQQKNVLLCDTTFRDAHQSLLATRLRTYDMVKAAPAYSYLLPTLFSIENWGGATFDVAYRFLRESPWRRLQLLREAIPNIPFQMLLRGANAVGYTAYADNVVEKFCTEAVNYGIDIFRVFDSLNYVENLRHGIQAAGSAGGVVEAAMVYTGNVGDPTRKPYTLEYYLDLASQLVATDCHILCIKDMAGLLTPKATKLLVGSLRQEFPHMPIHVHTHDTAGCGVASMIAAAEAGADVVDVAIDALAGLTSQPPMGALVSALQHTPLDPGVDLKAVTTLNDYFEQVRLYYTPFEATATLKSVSCDVYENEIPGGQYTNLHMQAFSLGLADQWPKVKAAYVAASRLLDVLLLGAITALVATPADAAAWTPQLPRSCRTIVRSASFLTVRAAFTLSRTVPAGCVPLNHFALCISFNASNAISRTVRTRMISINSQIVYHGNPPKVTPTSKVVGDLAQFMVQNNLDEAAVHAQADVLSFPSSVVQYFQGYLGQPPFGFPEPLRKKILGGKETINERPGAFLPAVNWTEVRERLERTHGRKFRDADLISSVLYPDVFDDFQRFLKSYGDVSMLPTPNYFKGILPGETITVHMAGREVSIKYIAQTHVHPDGTRDVFFNVMGLPRWINVRDTKVVKVVTNLKADPANPKHIGAPMPGNVLQIKVKRGQGVQKGQPVAIITAMKMETAVVAPIEGIVGEIPVKEGSAVQQGDLLVELQ